MLFFIIFLIYVIFLSPPLAHCGIFYYKNGGIGFSVSRGKYICYKNKFDNNGNCLSSKVLKIQPLTTQINLFESFNNLCNCQIIETENVENDVVFYLKRNGTNVFFQYVSESNWIIQPNCNSNGFNCLLSKHKCTI